MKKILNTLISSFISGILVSVGAIANLVSDNRYLGAFFFSVGLFFIVEYRYKLYTGAIGYLLDNKKEDNLMLPIIFIGNFIGAFFIASIISITRISPVIIEKAISMVNTKLNDTWYSVLILSFFCGLLIYLGVNTYKVSVNNLSKVFSIVISIIVFIISSYEHVIANMFYISLSKIWNIKSILYLLLMGVGNSIGGIFIPALSKLLNKTN